MHLGAAGSDGKPCPIRTPAAQAQAGGIDQIDGLAHGTVQAALRPCDHHGEQLAEHRIGAHGVGVGQGRARYGAPANVVETDCMALKAANDLPQTARPRKLPIQQRDELALGRQAPDPVIGPMLPGQSIKFDPRNPLQQVVENAILMPHGGGSNFVSRRRRKRLDTTRINTVRSVH